MNNPWQKLFLWNNLFAVYRIKAVDNNYWTVQRVNTFPMNNAEVFCISSIKHKLSHEIQLSRLFNLPFQ